MKYFSLLTWQYSLVFLTGYGGGGNNFNSDNFGSNYGGSNSNFGPMKGGGNYGGGRGQGPYQCKYFWYCVEKSVVTISGLDGFRLVFLQVCIQGIILKPAGRVFSCNCKLFLVSGGRDW